VAGFNAGHLWCPVNSSNNLEGYCFTQILLSQFWNKPIVSPTLRSTAAACSSTQPDRSFDQVPRLNEFHTTAAQDCDGALWTTHKVVVCSSPLLPSSKLRSLRSFENPPPSYLIVFPFPPPPWSQCLPAISVVVAWRLAVLLCASTERERTVPSILYSSYL